MPSPVRVGLVGLGGVAQGLLELLSSRPDPRFRIVSASDSEGTVVRADGLDAAALLAAKRGAGLRSLRGVSFESRFPLEELLDKAPCDVLLNLLPCNYETGEPALSLVRSALEGGAHVVTAEKASMVLGFETLRRSALAGNATLRYSACVGGSSPFIPILERLASVNPIRRATGVLNATTTYILSELEARRHSPAEILERAGRLGILERDPHHDTDGYDLAAKGVLVHNTIYPDPIPWNRAERRGIAEFLERPERLRTGTRLVVHVEPGVVRVEAATLPLHSPLRVYGLENALLVDSADAGELYIRGIGAGGRGTATNVYGDLVRVAHTLQGGEPNPGRAPIPEPVLHPHV